MKRLIYLPAFILMFSCGGNSELEESTGTEEGTVTEETVDNGLLDPSTDLNGDVNALDLINSMTFIYGKEFQMVVYPMRLYDGATYSQNFYASSTDGNGSQNDMNVYFELKEAPAEEQISKDEPILVKAKLEGIGFYGKLEFVDAEIIEKGTDKTNVAFDANSYKAENIYDPNSVIDYIKSWDGKEITVVGDYMGTTVSKSVDGTELLEARVDLGNFDGKVGCEFETEEASHEFEASEKNVRIKGTLSSELVFDSPRIKNCVRVK